MQNYRENYKGYQLEWKQGVVHIELHQVLKEAMKKGYRPVLGMSLTQLEQISLTVRQEQRRRQQQGCVPLGVLDVHSIIDMGLHV